MKRWGPIALVGLGYAVLLAAVFHRIAFGHQTFGWDCLREYWPDVVYQVRSLRHGTLPLWNPFSLGGYPFIGDPQAGTFAPVNWLCWLLSRLSGSEGPWLIELKVFVNLWLAFAGMHLAMRRRTGSHAAGAIGALVWVLGSPMLVHKNGAYLWPFCYLPWALLAMDRFLDAPTPRRGAALAVAIWLVGGAGHPQGFFYSLFILGLYWLYRTFSVGLRVQLKGLAVCVPIAVVLLLPIYLPAWQAVAASPRANRGPGYVLDGGVPGQALRELLVPNLDTDWQTDVYVGAAVFPLALYAFAVGIALKDRRRMLGRGFLWGLAILGMLLALSRAAGLLPFFAKHVPGFSLFRIAYRLKLIFGFAIAILAAEGAGEALAKHRPRWLLPALGAVWIVVCLVAGGGKQAGPILLGGGAVALLSVGDRRVAWGAVALVLADLWIAGQSKIDITQPPPDPKAWAPLEAKLDPSWRYFETDADRPLPYAAPYLRDDLREFSGFKNPITISRQEEVVARSLRAPQLLRAFNVRWKLHNGNRIEELPDPSPLVRLFPSATIDPKPLDKLTADPAGLYVEPGDAPADLPHETFAPVAGTVVSYTRNRITVDVDAPAPGVVVLNELWAPGWRADVNGKPANVFRANYLLRAVTVPAGASRVVFCFEPPHLGLLLAGFVLGLVCAGVCLGYDFRHLRRRA